VVEQTPRNTRAVTLAIPLFPSDPGPPLVQQPFSSDSTSEIEHGLLVKGPTVDHLRSATWVLVRPPRLRLAVSFQSQAVRRSSAPSADYHEGKDLREEPYSLFRLAIDGTFVQSR
jgi:hypothetical protein